MTSIPMKTIEGGKAIAIAPFERGDHVEVARRMIQILRKEGPLIVTDDRLWQYRKDAGVWIEVKLGELRGRIQGFSGAPVIVTKGTAPLSLTQNGIEGIAKCVIENAALQEPGFFDDAPMGVAFRNCFVSVDPERGTLTEEGGTALVAVDHTPENKARWSAPCDWEPLHPGGTWRSFLRSIFPGTEQAAIRSLIQEYVGAALLGVAARMQTCLIWIGEGANGKGVLSETLSSLFPLGACVSIDPSKWEKDAHAVAFERALLNVVDELPKRGVIESAKFKEIVAGDLVTCDRKYMSPITFRPRAGHIFSTNELPEWSDPSHGMWRRMVPIEFTRTFKTDDPDWRPRGALTAAIREDLPGIYACVLRAGARVAVTSRYTIPAGSSALKREWRGDLDFVRTWAEGGKNGAEKGWKAVGERYKEFAQWCRRMGHKPLSQPAWGRRLSVLGWERKKARSVGGIRWESRPSRQHVNDTERG